jgi:hypothetical protein
MLIEVMMYDYVLCRWRANPGAPKRSYGVMALWQDATPENDLPLTEREVEHMKAWLRQHAPTSYYRIFPEDRKELQ